MSHEAIGTATIDGAVTSIRKYDNGFYVVEVDHEVKYSSAFFLKHACKRIAGHSDPA